MLGRASPRNPRVWMFRRSASSLSLLVAWRWRLRAASSGLMPQPSSATRSKRRPPSSISTVTYRAAASREFSTSSLTTAAGRRMTSPAAIWAATWGARIRMARGKSPCLDAVTGLSFSFKEGCDPVLLTRPAGHQDGLLLARGAILLVFEFRVFSLQLPVDFQVIVESEYSLILFDNHLKQKS